MLSPLRRADRSSSRNPARPRVLYFARIDLPSPRANSIQTLNTCNALAQQGADVVLVVRRLLASRRDCFAHYGLTENSRLRFVSLSLPMPCGFNEWQGPYFRFYLGALLRRYESPETFVLTRDPAGLELLRTLHTLRAHPPTYFEIHKLSFLTKASHQEERGRSLDEPRVRAKIEARRRLEGEVYAAVDGLVCTTAGARALVDSYFPDHAPAVVVPNGVQGASDAAAAATLDDAGRDLDVVYAGQLYRWKGVDALVEAMAHLPERRLTIVGGSDPEDVDRVRRTALSAGVADRVDFAGHVAPSAVAGFLARARVGVVPLPEQGFVEAALFTSPLKAFELMRAGVPIVASDLPAVRELLQDGEHAVLVPPDDPRALAAGIDRLLGDRRLASRLVQAAAARVLDFGWERRAARILSFATRPAAAVGGR